MTDVIGDISLGLSLLGILVFIVAYLVRVGLPKGEMANHVFFFMVVLMMAAMNGVAHAIWGRYPFDIQVEDIIGAFGAVVIWWRVILFLRLQKKTNDEATAEDEVTQKY